MCVQKQSSKLYRVRFQFHAPKIIVELPRIFFKFFIWEENIRVTSSFINFRI